MQKILGYDIYTFKRFAFLTVKSINKITLFPVVKCTTNEDVASLKSTKHALLGNFQNEKELHENRTSDQGVAYLSVMATLT